MPKAVYFLMLPNVLLLDVSGPAEVLRLAGQFQLHYVSPVPQVTCSIGMTIGQLAPLPQRWNEGDLLVIPGVADSTHYFATEEAALARNWLRALRPTLAQRQIDLVCVCSGALLAAQAGLLDGYHCTTHHAVIDRLRQQAPPPPQTRGHLQTGAAPAQHGAPRCTAGGRAHRPSGGPGLPPDPSARGRPAS